MTLFLLQEHLGAVKIAFSRQEDPTTCIYTCTHDNGKIQKVTFQNKCKYKTEENIFRFLIRWSCLKQVSLIVYVNKDMQG